jgi:dipeptidyl aminopeptidase/acylaminoacyl peptidase
MPQRPGAFSFLLLLLCFSTLPVLAVQADLAPVPVESFFRRGPLADIALSPDGKYLATVVGSGGNDVLTVTDLATREQRVLTSPEVNVLHAVWTSDERLLYQIQGRGPGILLRAIDRDGTRYAELSDSDRAYAGPRSHPVQDWKTVLTDPCARNKDVIYVTNHEADWSDETQKVNLVRIDTRSGRGGTVARPGRVATWMLDAAGEPDLVTVAAGDPGEERIRLLVRDDPAAAWRTRADTAGDDFLHAIAPLQFGPDGTLYVTARAGRDKAALYAFDLAKGQLAPAPLFERAGYDFSGDLVANCSKVLGVHYFTDVEAIEWFDPAMKTVQANVDRLLPGTTNLITVPARAQTPWMLVRAYADVAPASYWLFNAETLQTTAVANSHAPIDATRLGRQQMLHYGARDGLDISARLTLPPGPQQKNLPLVMLVHGGPWLHGPIAGFDAESQFLASRGYAVLEPAYRGSTGYGYAHFNAGWKQWGLAMQDDIADGARWAIAQGYADAHRICIAGASYGGYATLMGLVNDPDLYRCGIDWTGITDIGLLFSGNWTFPTDIAGSVKDAGFREKVGDPEKDAARFDATSPLRQAARIRQPLLLAYGGLDGRVPITHGTRLRDAVRRVNHDVEWVEYPDEGHGWAKVSTNADFWGRVERFLARTIGDKAADWRQPAQ